MAELADIVSFGDFTPIDQLRRAQLWRIADRLGIPYPVDAPKSVMINVLQSNSIDVTKPQSGIQWERVTGSDENGRNTAFLAPRVEPHHSARVGVDSTAVLRDRVAEPDEDKGPSEVDALKAQIARLEAKLDAKATPRPKRKNPGAGARLKRYRELKKLLTDRGITVTKGMKLDELEKLAAG